MGVIVASRIQAHDRAITDKIQQRLERLETGRAWSLAVSSLAWACYLSPREAQVRWIRLANGLHAIGGSLPYHSTHGVMALVTLGHDGDAGSSVHFGDAIPWKCCLRPPTHNKSPSRYYVSQIFAQAKVIPSHPILSSAGPCACTVRPSFAGFGDAGSCCCLSRVDRVVDRPRPKFNAHRRLKHRTSLPCYANSVPLPYFARLFCPLS